MKIFILHEVNEDGYSREYVDAFRTRELGESYLELLVKATGIDKSCFRIEEKNVVDSLSHPMFYFEEKKFYEYNGKEFKEFTLNNIMYKYGDIDALFRGKIKAKDQYWENEYVDQEAWEKYLVEWSKMRYEEREKREVLTTKNFIVKEQILHITRPVDYGKENIHQEWINTMELINQLKRKTDIPPYEISQMIRKNNE